MFLKIDNTLIAIEGINFVCIDDEHELSEDWVVVHMDNGEEVFIEGTIDNFEQALQHYLSMQPQDD